MNYDFDEIVNRRGTDSYKWDSAADADVIPMWVADMDFRTAPEVIDTLSRRVAHGIFGYVRVPEEYYTSLSQWFATRHGWNIARESVIYTSGVVPAVSAIIKALTSPGNGVIVQMPAYNCFFSSIRNNGCRLVENRLTRVETKNGFRYEIDFEALEHQAADDNNRLMLLCNPHNPTGRVWTREELGRVADICRRNGVTVVSDEIHCELTRGTYRYTPYATVDSDAVACCSPSKAFNIAGLQIANIVAPDSEVRARIDRAINDNEVCDVNPFGVVALQAAYNHGGAWLDALHRYLDENYRVLRDFFAEKLPMLKVCDIEATYLAWIDVSLLNIGSEMLEQRLLDDGKVWVNCGSMYGSDGYVRINFACPRSRMLDGLNRFYEGLKRMNLI